MIRHAFPDAVVDKIWKMYPLIFQLKAAATLSLIKFSSALIKIILYILRLSSAVHNCTSETIKFWWKKCGQDSTLLSVQPNIVSVTANSFNNITRLTKIWVLGRWSFPRPLLFFSSLSAVASSWFLKQMTTMTLAARNNSQKNLLKSWTAYVHLIIV